MSADLGSGGETPKPRQREKKQVKGERKNRNCRVSAKGEESGTSNNQTGRE